MALLLADEFFFAAHDEVTGRRGLSEEAMGVGLAAALLAELNLLRRIEISRGRIRITDSRPPDDPLDHMVLHEIAGNSDVTTIREWLRYLARRSHEQVAERLYRAGRVRPTEVRRLLRTRRIYVPVDMNVAAWPAARLTSGLDRGDVPPLPDILLAGLIVATGLEGLALSGLSNAASHHLRQLLAGLPPPLRVLVADTETTIGEAAMSPHRR